MSTHNLLKLTDACAPISCHNLHTYIAVKSKVFFFDFKILIWSHWRNQSQSSGKDLCYECYKMRLALEKMKPVNTNLPQNPLSYRHHRIHRRRLGLYHVSWFWFWCRVFRVDQQLFSMNLPMCLWFSLLLHYYRRHHQRNYVGLDNIQLLISGIVLHHSLLIDSVRYHFTHGFQPAFNSFQQQWGFLLLFGCLIFHSARFGMFLQLQIGFS
jgi:hypothetical protein